MLVVRGRLPSQVADAKFMCAEASTLDAPLAHNAVELDATRPQAPHLHLPPGGDVSQLGGPLFGGASPRPAHATLALTTALTYCACSTSIELFRGTFYGRFVFPDCASRSRGDSDRGAVPRPGVPACGPVHKRARHPLFSARERGCGGKRQTSTMHHVYLRSPKVAGHRGRPRGCAMDAAARGLSCGLVVGLAKRIVGVWTKLVARVGVDRRQMRGWKGGGSFGRSAWC